MTETAKLIADLEKAKEGSRELDGRVWCARVASPFVMWDGAGCVYRGDDGSIHHRPSERIHHYTTNLQDAVDAVPEGWHVEKVGQPICGTTWFAWLRKTGTPTLVVSWQWETPHLHCATPALALSIATLKAKEAEND